MPCLPLRPGGPGNPRGPFEAETKQEEEKKADLNVENTSNSVSLVVNVNANEASLASSVIIMNWWNIKKL